MKYQFQKDSKLSFFSEFKFRFSKLRILIIGSNGQLGSEIEEICSEYENIECLFKDLPDLIYLILIH